MTAGTDSATRAVARRRTLALAAVMAFSLGMWGLAAPGAAAACLCEHSLQQSDVVFTGVVTDSPNRSILFRDVWEGDRGVYTFDVKEVIRGDPLDGRVWTSYGYGGCGRIFELGATYEVHANIAHFDVAYPGGPPEAPLTTGICTGGEYLKGADPVVVIRALAITPEGVTIGLVGLGLIAGVGTFAWRPELMTASGSRPG